MRKSVKGFKKIAIAAGALLLSASPVLACSLYGNYSVQFIGPQMHGTGSFNVNGPTVTAQWNVNRITGPDCVVNGTGTVNDTGPILNSVEFDMTITSKCLAKPAKIQMTVEPFGYDQGFYFNVSNSPYANTGTGMLQNRSN